MRPTAFVAAATLAIVRSAVVGAQEPDRVERPLGEAMAFAAGATCLEAERLAAQARTWLGRERVPADVRIDVEGDPVDPHRVVFRIARGKTTHERRFDRLPDACDDATAVLGLAIALAIDASVLAGAFAPAAPAEAPRKLVAIELGGGVEVAPGTSAGVAAGIEYGLLPWLAARVDLETQFSRHNPIPETSGTFDAALVALAPQICMGGDAASRVRLELCSGAAAGILHAQGHGFVTSRAATGSWIVGQAGVRLLLLAGVPWVLDVAGIFPLYVPEFRGENAAGQPEYRAFNPPGALLSTGPVFSF